jgi:hypothetical protein
MRLFLHDGPAHLQIVPRSGIREFRDPAAAVELLRPLLAQPRNAAAIRAALGDAMQRTDEQLVEELARRIVDEGLQVVSCADSFFASLQSTATIEGSSQSAKTTPLEDEQAAKEEKQAAMQPKETHWIEIELVDDSGTPVADEMYLVELPDGSKLTGRTDANGRARVDDVDPGTAKVSFPDLDKSAYTPK